MTPRSLLRRLAGLRPQTPMRGRIEGVCNGVAWGWARNRQDPDQAATVDVTLDGTVLGRATATLRRRDHLGDTGPGQLTGFTFDLRPFLAPDTRGTLGLCDPSTGLAFGKTLALDMGGGSGALEMGDGIDVLGWATPHAPGARDIEVEIRVDGAVAGTVRTDVARHDLWQAGATLPRAGFRFAMPARYHDGQAHAVTAHIAATGQPLQEAAIAFCAETRTYVDVVDEHHLMGWIANLKAPEGAVRFDVWLNGRCVRHGVTPELVREDVEQALFGPTARKCPIGFDIRWQEPPAWLPEGNSIELRVPGRPDRLHGPVHQLEPSRVVEVLEALAARLLADPVLGAAYDPALRAAARTQRAQAVGGMRARPNAPMLVAEPVEPPAQAPVDVIIPVDEGRAATVVWIGDALAALPGGPAMELVVIFDAGPDLTLKAELQALAAAKGFSLIENAANLGFVATVNKGMRLHPDRDVVLLNADTVVPHGWLQRLRAAALSAPDIATATPLSNRATIFSLPRSCIDNDLPPGLDVAALDALCAEHNPGVRVDVPTAMGFCMYIRRQALLDVGLFDEARWAQGYGEENDFSLRALARGWRHVAACDVFVEHHGAVSFGAEKPRRVKENLAKLDALYPDYAGRVQRFIEADPIAPARARVNIALLQRLATSWVLFVSHGMGGGTDTAIHDLRRGIEAAGRRVLLLRSAAGDRIELLPLIEPHDETLVTELPRDTPVAAIAAHLAPLPIAGVHLHHTIGFDAAIWELPALLGVPFEVTLHDYYTVCPRVTMIDATERFCGEPDVAVCEACVAGSPRLERTVRRQLEAAGGSVAQWRAFHGDRLAGATRVATPSQDAARRLARHLPDLMIQAIPHPEPAATAPAPARPGPLHHVAVIGAIGRHKGGDLLFDVATLAGRMDLPLRFVVIGYTHRDEDFAELANVEITGRYRGADLPRLLAASQCGTALFLSVWPETYSYTLSEAWRAGMLPVALDIGAQAERIRERGDGVLIPFSATAREVVEGLIALQ